MNHVSKTLELELSPYIKEILPLCYY